MPPLLPTSFRTIWNGQTGPGRVGANEVGAKKDFSAGWSHTLAATKQPSATARAFAEGTGAVVVQKGDLSPGNPEMLKAGCQSWMSLCILLRFSQPQKSILGSRATSLHSNNGWGSATAPTGGGWGTAFCAVAEDAGLARQSQSPERPTRQFAV